MLEQTRKNIQVEILVADLGLGTDLNRVANAIAGDERVTVLDERASRCLWEQRRHSIVCPLRRAWYLA
jgi:hypothetical protein